MTLHFGFSYIGFLYLLMLMIPNLIWVKRKPQHYDQNNESKVLLGFERVGEVLVSCCAIVFTDFNFHGIHVDLIWLILSFIIMLAYLYWWYRYFHSPRTLSDFYQPLGIVPVAGATLPIIAFFLLGIYGKHLLMLISVMILGIGHIGIHLQHLKETRK